MAEEGVETVMANHGDVESKIKSAMHSRISYFINQSDSLKFEGVRRLLEKDLGMPEFSLDTHKSFVKELLIDFLNQSAEASPKEEVEDDKTKSEDPILGEKMDESPVMGLLQGEPMQTSIEKEDNETNFEEVVTKALWERASYIQNNSENVTMAGLRRVLEEDLNLEKFSLDPLKKLISSQLDEILNASETPEKPMKKSVNKGAKAQSSEEENPSKKTRKRKNPTKETTPKKKPNARIDTSDNQSNSSGETHKTTKEVSSTQTYGKRVEHLKSVIKQCSLNVPPAIYRKVKQLSEAQREAQLIKELEAILGKEGLSSDPSEKEIKEVKRRKERAKDLEGIDMSNIVSSSRRRSSHVPLKKAGTESEPEEEENGDENSEEDGENNEIEEIKDVNEDDDDQTNEESEDSSDENDDESEYEDSE